MGGGIKLCIGTNSNDGDIPTASRAHINKNSRACLSLESIFKEL